MKSDTPGEKYYVQIEDREHGPFHIKELQNLLNEQIATPNSLVREENSLETTDIQSLLNQPAAFKEQRVASRPSTITGSILISLSVILIIITLGFYYKNSELSKLLISQREEFEARLYNLKDEIKNEINKDFVSVKNTSSTIEKQLNILQAEINKTIIKLEAINKVESGVEKIQDQFQSSILEEKKERKEKVQETNNQLLEIKKSLELNHAASKNYYSEFKAHKAVRDDLDFRLKAMHTRVSDLEQRQKGLDAWVGFLNNKFSEIKPSN